MGRTLSGTSSNVFFDEPPVADVRSRDLDFDALGVEWVPENAQPLKRGKFRLMHGHQIGKWLPKYPAAKVAAEWGPSN